MRHLKRPAVGGEQVPVDYALPGGPVLLGGPVVTGFGRGSRQMGVPTANIDPVPLQDVLSGLPLGVYFGCAGLYELRVQELKALQVGCCSAWPTKHGFTKTACWMQMVLSVLQTMHCCQDNQNFTIKQ